MVQQRKMTNTAFASSASSSSPIVNKAFRTQKTTQMHYVLYCELYSLRIFILTTLCVSGQMHITERFSIAIVL